VATRELHNGLPPGWELFVEHKPYEPSFYASVPTEARRCCSPMPVSVRSALDLAEHASTGRAACTVGRLGGFHFNDSKYGDDDSPLARSSRTSSSSSCVSSSTTAAV
jgi:L-rhamnose isomerase/sugar isomerase